MIVGKLRGLLDGLPAEMPVKRLSYSGDRDMHATGQYADLIVGDIDGIACLCFDDGEASHPGIISMPLADYVAQENEGSMIRYDAVKVGDILRLVGDGAPGYAELGDLLRIVEVNKNGLWVEDRHGDRCEFVFGCGAARLEPTEWHDDFPEEMP